MKRKLIIWLADGSTKEIDLSTAPLQIGVKKNSPENIMLMELIGKGYYDKNIARWIGPGFIKYIESIFTDK